MQNKSLKQQLVDKEKQISTFEQQTHKHVNELSELQEKLKQLKDENEDQQIEKENLENQLAEAKKENSDLQSKSTDAPQSSQNVEQLIESLCDEKDLQEVHKLSLLVQHKYMNMYSQKILENLS